MQNSISPLFAVGLSLAAVLSVDPDRGGVAQAQSIVSTGESFVTAGLLVGPAHADGSREAGLVLAMAEGWKTYWRQPGEAGIPPSFDWSRSANVADVEIDWPRPTSFESFGLRTLGYSDTVVLPMTIRPVDPAAPVTLDLGVALGVCDDICILEETRVGATIAPGETGPGAEAIATARRAVPLPGTEQGLTLAECRITGAGADRGFVGRFVFDRPLSEPIVVLEGPTDSWFHGTEIAAANGTIDVTAKLSLIDPAAWIGRGDLRITVLDGELAADIRGCPAANG